MICMALLGDPKILLCDEIFAALDVLTIQMLKEILVKLQNEKPQMCIIICEHQARELLSVVDRAMILSNTKIIAQGTPSQLIKNENAKTAYFGEFLNLIKIKMPKYVTINKIIKPFKKKIYVSGDKSLSIRWALLASQAVGKSRAYNLLKSEDVINTIKGLRKLGVKNKSCKNFCEINGVGINGFKYKKKKI